jgi:hypothetical protein
VKKGFKFYLIAWAILFVIFNVVVIALPKETTIAGVTYQKLGGLSWITLILFELCFIGHLVCTWIALKRNKLSGMFYRLPLIRLSYACIIVTTVIGCVMMAVPQMPDWIPLIVVLIIMALYAVAVLKAAAAAEVVEQIDEKVKVQTAFIKTLTVDAQTLLSRAKSEQVRAACKKVFEAVRYSDPMSAETLSDVESRIRTEFDSFTDAVISDNAEAATASADELLTLIQERNSNCKMEK